MTVLDLLLGRPLASDEARAECVGPAAGIPIFGLDALSSAAYGPEAALTLLIPLGAAGIAYMVPISASIIVLLTIVYFSYRQTIQAYPGGGGSYTVARQNLGVSAGLLAAAALMIDYVLVVAVGISAGVGALVSAVPSLQAAYACVVPRNSGAHYSRQSPRRAGNWADLHGSYISVCRKPFRGDCDRTLQDFRGWRSSLGA